MVATVAGPENGGSKRTRQTTVAIPSDGAGPTIATPPPSPRGELAILCSESKAQRDQAHFYAEEEGGEEGGELMSMWVGHRVVHSLARVFRKRASSRGS